MSFNKIIIVGNMGKDPDLKYTPSGAALCKFSVATTEKRKDQAGEMREYTTWFNCTAWSKTAEIVHEHFKKGSQIYCEGRLRLETWTDRDGNPRTNLEVNVSGIEFVGGGNRQQGGFDPDQVEQRQPGGERQQSRGRQINEDDELGF